MAYTLEDLRDNLDKLSPKDRDFGFDLVRKGGKYGLSDKQRYWVDRLTKTAKGELKPLPKEGVALGGNLQAAIDLFDYAKDHLKYPKVILAVGETRVRLSIAGERAKVPGSINITGINRNDDDTRDWYGRITRDGVFHPARAAENLPGLADVLKAFAADPAQVAAGYGKLTGHCAFCSRPLTDERSTAVGYGPRCAEVWNQPWGEKA